MTVHLMWLPTPPEFRIVIVSPLLVTLHDSPFSMRFPEPLNLKHSKPVIVAVAPQLSVAVAVKEIGALGGTMVAGALHSGTGDSSSITVTVAWQKSVSPVWSLTFNVTLLWPTGYGLGGDCRSSTGPPSGS